MDCLMLGIFVVSIIGFIITVILQAFDYDLIAFFAFITTITVFFSFCYVVGKFIMWVTGGM